MPASDVGFELKALKSKKNLEIMKSRLHIYTTKLLKLSFPINVTSAMKISFDTVL